LTILILRPNGDNSVQWNQYGATPNYACIDEAVASDDDLIYPGAGGGTKRDHYNFPNHTSEVGTINSVKIYARCWYAQTGTATKPHFHLNVTSGTEGDEQTPTLTPAIYTQIWTTNPDDSAAWEWSDIDALLAGITGIAYYPSGGNYTNLYCSQFYIEVDYTTSNTYDVSCSDGFKIGDPTVKASLSIGVSCSDGLKGGDASTPTAIFQKALSEGFKIGDSPAVGLLYQLLVSEGFKIGDTALAGLVYQLLASDGLKLSEALSHTFATNPSLVEGLKLGDTPITQANLQNILAEGLKLSEALTGQKVTSPILAEGLKLSDSPINNLSIFLSILEGLKAGDSPSHTLTLSLSLSDGFVGLAGEGRLIGSGDVSADSSIDVDTFHLSQFTARFTGIVRRIYIKAEDSCSVKLAIYSDSAGEPDILLNALNTETALIAGWNTVEFPSTSIIKGTNYWLGFNSG
jgi:hypothetical protein